MSSNAVTTKNIKGLGGMEKRNIYWSIYIPGIYNISYTSYVLYLSRRTII